MTNISNRLLAAVVILLLGLVLGTFVPMRAQSSSNRQELPQPTDWVAFSAVQTVYPINGTPQEGRYYRNQLGSERWEITDSVAHKTIIDILNVSQSMFYTSSPGAGWVSRRTDLNVLNHRPRHWATPMVGLSRYSFRLDVAVRGSGNIRAETGYEAYVYAMSDGDVRLLAPDLNFFPVVQQRLGRYTRIYSAIQVGDQLADMFEPPAGVVVTPLATPRNFKQRDTESK